MPVWGRGVVCLFIVSFLRFSICFVLFFVFRSVVSVFFDRYRLSVCFLPIRVRIGPRLPFRSDKNTKFAPIVCLSEFLLRILHFSKFKMPKKMTMISVVACLTRNPLFYG